MSNLSSSPRQSSMPIPPSTASGVTTTSPSDKCPICLDNILFSDSFTSTSCGHLFCNDCIRGYLKVIAKEQSKFPVPCPVCDVTLDHLTCLQVASADRDLYESLEVFIIYKRFYSRLRFCANPRCNIPFDWREDPLMRGHPTEFRVVCPLCSTATCVMCRNVWHTGACSNTPFDDSGVVEFGRLAREKMWRLCSNCGHMVEKASGCNYISCRCGHGFCYACGGTKSHGGNLLSVNVAGRMPDSNTRRCVCTPTRSARTALRRDLTSRLRNWPLQEPTQENVQLRRLLDNVRNDEEECKIQLASSVLRERLEVLMPSMRNEIDELVQQQVAILRSKSVEDSWKAAYKGIRFPDVVGSSSPTPTISQLAGSSLGGGPSGTTEGSAQNGASSSTQYPQGMGENRGMSGMAELAVRMMKVRVLQRTTGSPEHQHMVRVMHRIPEAQRGRYANGELQWRDLQAGKHGYLNITSLLIGAAQPELSGNIMMALVRLVCPYCEMKHVNVHNLGKHIVDADHHVFLCCGRLFESMEKMTSHHHGGEHGSVGGVGVEECG